MNYHSSSYSDPLPLSSPKNSPLNSPSYSAPLPRNSPASSPTISLPLSSPRVSTLPRRNIQDIATPLNCNLLPPLPADEDPPLYFTSENKHNYYFLEDLIGYSGDSPMYKTSFSPFGCEPLKILVAVMPVNHKDGEYKFVVSKINQNHAVDDFNVLAVREEVNVGGRLWMVLEYVGPSACVMYPQGASLPKIANTLFDTVKALVSIHAKKLVHGNVNIQNIYVQQGPPYLCKLGFGVTRHVCLQTPCDYDCLSLYKIYEWGNSPEFYSKINAGTSSSDIWQSRVSAVEVATGNIWEKDRKEFIDFVGSVTKDWDFGVLKDADLKKNCRLSE